jgi:hypothetical protein
MRDNQTHRIERTHVWHTYSCFPFPWPSYEHPVRDLRALFAATNHILTPETSCCEGTESPSGEYVTM